MEQPRIVLVVGENTYNLCASDLQVMREMPSTDRQQLITLLEALKQQDIQADALVQKAVARARMASQPTSNTALVGDPVKQQPKQAERLGSGDVDALMSRLIMEENRNKKPGITKQTLYMWVAGSAAVIVLLTLMS